MIARNPDGTLFTTRAQRTGCSMCGFGIHLERRPHRFDRLREQNPKEWSFWMYDQGWGEALTYIGVGWEETPQEAINSIVDQVNAESLSTVKKAAARTIALINRHMIDREYFLAYNPQALVKEVYDEVWSRVKNKMKVANRNEI